MSSTFTKGLIASFKKGKQILQTVLKTKTQKVAVKVAKPECSVQKYQVARQPVQYQSRLHQVWKGIVPRVYYNSIAAQFARQAAWRAGRNAPLLAFFGLVVSQNSKEDEITSRIQDFLKTDIPYEKELWEGVQKLSLDNFEFGSRIGQGCNAAVYEARLKAEEEENFSENNVSEPPQEIPLNFNNIDKANIQTEDQEKDYDHDNEISSIENSDDDASDTDSDITVISWDSDEEYLQNEGAPILFTTGPDKDIEETAEINMDVSDDEFDIIEDEDLPSQCDDTIASHTSRRKLQAELNEIIELDKLNLVENRPAITMLMNVNEWYNQGLENGLESVEEDEEIEMYHSMDSSVLQDDGRTRPKLKYDLAVKMMFNYDIESNATAILKSMEKETIPARFSANLGQAEFLKTRNKDGKKILPPHPNIVEMWGVFVDPVPSLPDSLSNYPAALPCRINPDGMGRNMTMFIVMKKYDMTLTEYLSTFNLSFRERIYLLAQLLEAVDHLSKHGIAHRDMKADNILLDTFKDGVPNLVLSDFGCCLADKRLGLKLPYPTDEIDKGGNTALMPPEIVCAEPGPSVKLDYRKADLWSVGAIAYEILGAYNPFYSSTNGKLDSHNYSETELPPLPEEVPCAIREAILLLLSRSPQNRPSARQVLNILYTYMWAPKEWLDPEVEVKVTRSDVMWWIVTMATDLLLKQKFSRCDVVDTLMGSFIRKLKFRDLCVALKEFNTYVI